MPHAGTAAAEFQSVISRNSNPRVETGRAPALRMTHADEGGCRAPGPHAITTRTAHTTTTSSIDLTIDRVPKTAGRIPGSTLPSAIATGWGIYQSTSLPGRLRKRRLRGKRSLCDVRSAAQEVSPLRATPRQNELLISLITEAPAVGETAVVTSHRCPGRGQHAFRCCANGHDE